MRKEPQSLSFPPSHMPSVIWTTLVSHIGHSLESVIAVACNFSPCEPPQNKLCTSSATPAPCDSKKTPCTSFPLFVRHLYCYVLCASFSVTPPCSQRVCGGGIALLQYLAQITLESSAQQRTECEEKPSSSLPVVHEFVSIIRFSPGFNVVIRRAAFSGTCPYVFAPQSPLRLAREKDHLLGSPQTFC